MKFYLKDLDLWEAIQEDYEIPPLLTNFTMNRIKIYKEWKTKKSKAKFCLFSRETSNIFAKIMNLEPAKVLLDCLK